MPNIQGISEKYRVYFFSNERFGSKLEQSHVHVKKGDAEAKVWISNADVAENFGFSRKEINEIKELVTRHKEKIQRTWDDYFKEENR
jgi:polyphosphate kinase